MEVSQKFIVIGLLLLATLLTGVWLGLLGKPLNGLPGVLHKILALILVIFLAIRVVHSARLFDSRPALLAAVAVLAVSILAAFASGIIESIPSLEGPAWLVLHRVAASVAALAGAVTARLLILNKP